MIESPAVAAGLFFSRALIFRSIIGNFNILQNTIVMKFILYIPLLFAFPMYSYCQYAAPQVLASAGNNFNNSDVSISWTLGEIAIETLISEPMTLTQGFQQPELIVNSLQEPDDNDLDISVYPNPTSGIISVEVNGHMNDQIIVDLFDSTGRLLLNRKNENYPVRNKLDLNPYSDGIYLLKVRATANGGAYNTIRIAKISK